MLAYARFQARGYPIGSGSVESANTVVMEMRLKGAGMHWARPHVNPWVALCTPPTTGPVAITLIPPLVALPMQPMAPPLSLPTESQAPKAPYRPPPDHPWRRFHIGRVKSPRPSAAVSAKL